MAECAAAEPPLAPAWSADVLGERPHEVVNGHVLYVDSPWAITSISEAQFWKGIDLTKFGDGTVNGIAHGTTAIGDGVRHSQSGNTRSYAVWVVVGAIVILAVIFFWPGASKTAVGLVR